MCSCLKALIPHVGVGSLCSPLEMGADRAEEAASELAALIAHLGAELVELGTIDDPAKASAAGRRLAESHVHAAAFAISSWFEDYLVLDLLEECNVPVLLWSLPGMETGALCGTQQLTAYLKQLGQPYRAIYGSLGCEPCRERAWAFLRAATLRYRLRRARIGLAGHRVGGMTEVAANELALKKAVGPRILPLDLPELLERARQLPLEPARQLWQQLLARVGSCRVAEPDGLEAIKFYTAVRELVDRHGLDALTIGCYPHLMGRVCLAASLLADEGVPLGCEGDVNGVIGQLMLALLTGQPTHNTDWLEPLEDGTVVFTHCGSGSFTLAEEPENIELATVRLMGQGVCVVFAARPGPVTLLNLTPSAAGYQMALLEGEALRTEMVFPGNPLRVRFNLPTAQLIDWIHREGIGHHWMAGYGHVGQELRQWAAMAGPQLKLCCPPELPTELRQQPET